MKKILIVIILLAGFLRFYNLGTNSPSLTWDEAVWGYNSYSLGIDGKDEFGRFLPHDYLESFGDFKPPVYAYLGILPVKILGLNEFSTRFPSAFLGTLTVLITYFLAKRLFNISEFKEQIGLVSAFILAVSPWHILLSRAAFEANVATFFIVLGVWLFLESVQNNSKMLFFSVTAFVLSIYTFNSARIVAPVMLVILSIANYKKLLSEKKVLIGSIVLGIVMVLPTFKFLLSPQAKLRYQEVNIFSDINIIKVNNQEVANDGNALWSKAIHNFRFVFARDFLNHYFDNLNPDFLFIKGDGNPKFSTQETGQMYLWELPFFITGLIFLFRKGGRNWWIIPVWLLVGIIPAALARETPHALRTEGTLPTWQMITAFGVVLFINSVKKYKKLAIGIVAAVCLINTSYFVHDYFVQYPKEYSREWQYGYVDSIDYAESVKSKFNKIYFTTVLGRPYIYVLFYTKYDPAKFRNSANITRDIFGFVHVNGFDKYAFLDTLPDKSQSGEKDLFINDSTKVPKNAKILKTFKLLSNDPIMTAYTF